MKILYEDKQLVVAVKPAGVLSQNDENKPNMLSLLSQTLSGELYPVHRLDKETAGVMVFARTRNAAAHLSCQIQNGSWEKEYLAVLQGTPKEAEGTLEDLLFFDRSKNKVFPVKRERKGVKKAVLTYRILEEKNGLTLVSVLPKTGRTHQIRVQFASRKLPLFGDRKYSGSGDGLGLFCKRLSFFHPKTNQWLSFSAVPEEKTPWIAFSNIT
jgi:23S rRNA pseudouridine1911/1915/1917 synthase